MENTKKDTVKNTSKVENKSPKTEVIEEQKSKSPFSLKLEMSVTDVTIAYEKVENEYGGKDETDIAKGVNLSYVHLEEKDGEDFINEQSVYIDYKWDMFQERDEELIDLLTNKDVKLIQPQESDGLFAKGFEIIGETKKPYFNLNRFMKMEIQTVIDFSSTFNKVKTIKTEIATIFQGAKKSKKLPIILQDIPISQVKKFKNKEVLVENIIIKSKQGSFSSSYSTKTLPTEI